MFKQAALAAVAAAAFIAAPASAAVTVVYTSTQNVGLIPGPAGIASGGFQANVIGTESMPADPSFTATFFFISPLDGNAAASAISIALSAMSNIDFTSVTLNGNAGTVVNGTLDSAYVFSVPVMTGVTNTLVFNGVLNPPSGVGNGAFGGNVTIAAIPEPTTWALFILGFGAIGYGLRRRNAQVRVARSAMRFA